MPRTSHAFAISISVIVLCIFGLFAFGSLFASEASYTDNASSTLSEPSRQISGCCEPASHVLVGSYSLQDNFSAKLLLNNKGGDPLEVQPTLYDLHGQELQLPSVTVPAQGFQFFDIREWAGVGGESFKKGEIKLVHGGVDLVLGAQIYFTDEVHSLTFEERLQELGKFNSQKQEAVWWMPSNQAQVQIIMTNTTEAPLTVTARLSRKPHKTGDPQIFEFTPHETKVLDLRQDFNDGNQFAHLELIALSLEHTGTAIDALSARIWIDEESSGYSNTLRFSNPDSGKSQEYDGAGFQIEDINQIHFTPVIVARNVGTEDSVVTTRVPYTRTDGTKGVITLPAETIKAGRMVQFNTQKIVRRVQQEQIAVASLEVRYDTAPGSIIVAAQSVSPDYNQVFRVLINDPLALPNASGGYPWRIEDTSTTYVYIKNVADYEEDYVAFLVWEGGGMYTIGMNPIGAHETINIDVKKLRDEQIPDNFGRTVPAWVSQGQLHWSVRRKDSQAPDDPLAIRSLIGRSQQVDIQKGIVTDYVCASCCANSYQAALIKPNPEPSPTTSQDVVVAGQTINFVAVEQQSTCSNEFTQGSPQFVNQTAAWSSNDTNIATVGSTSGVVTGVAPGTTTILATWTARSYSPIMGTCHQVAQFNVTAQRTVVVPPNVTDVTPDGATKITQITGNSNIIHFVTPKGGANDLVTLTAAISPDTTANRNNIDWEGATEDPSNPLKATVSKSAAAKSVVKIKYSGTVIKELRVWVVWATITSANIANSGNTVTTGNPPGSGFSYTGGYNFTETIQPPEIISDADRPNLSGANVHAPPGGNHPIYGSGFPLSGGAGRKWDASRQIRFKILNPNSIGVNDTAFSPYGFPSDLLNYPADPEGNDDSSTGDETNDPYSNGGVLTGSDAPLMAMANRGGIDGDTFELRLQFREFARLEIEGTWYKISDFYLWKFHFVFLKQGGVWVDNGSTKSLDNSGF